jgi:hypothetical protein
MQNKGYPFKKEITQKLHKNYTPQLGRNLAEIRQKFDTPKIAQNLHKICTVFFSKSLNKD